MIWLWLLALIIPIIASLNVKFSFSKYSKVKSQSGYTGETIARKILDENGLYNVRIEKIEGNLTDHFDPTVNVVRLSEAVYDESSVAALGVAAHECGHAIQFAQEYEPMKLKHSIIPMTNIGSRLSYPLVLLGLMLSLKPLLIIGIILFISAVVIQTVTLPVEFDASSRALNVIESSGSFSSEEQRGTKKVLKAAALTYVAALFSSILNLLRLIAIARD